MQCTVRGFDKIGLQGNTTGSGPALPRGDTSLQTHSPQFQSSRLQGIYIMQPGWQHGAGRGTLPCSLLVCQMQLMVQSTHLVVLRGGPGPRQLQQPPAPSCHLVCTSTATWRVASGAEGGRQAGWVDCQLKHDVGGRQVQRDLCLIQRHLHRRECLMSGGCTHVHSHTFRLIFCCSLEEYWLAHCMADAQLLWMLLVPGIGFSVVHKHVEDGGLLSPASDMSASAEAPT